MILYHGTSEENKIKILKEGFTANYGEYGTCLYLAKSKVQYQYVNSTMDYTEICVFDLSVVEINAENSIDLF